MRYIIRKYMIDLTFRRRRRQRRTKALLQCSIILSWHWARVGEGVSCRLILIWQASFDEPHQIVRLAWLIFLSPGVSLFSSHQNMINHVLSQSMTILANTSPLPLEIFWHSNCVLLTHVLSLVPASTNGESSHRFRASWNRSFLSPSLSYTLSPRGIPFLCSSAILIFSFSKNHRTVHTTSTDLSPETSRLRPIEINRLWGKRLLRQYISSSESSEVLTTFLSSLRLLLLSMILPDSRCYE